MLKRASSATKKEPDGSEVSDQHHPLARGFVLGALVTAAMAVFVIQNTATVGFEWLWFEFDAALWLALVVAFVAGVLAGPLLVRGWKRSTTSGGAARARARVRRPSGARRQRTA